MNRDPIDSTDQAGRTGPFDPGDLADLTVVDAPGLVRVGDGDVIAWEGGAAALLAAARQDALVIEFPVVVEVRVVPACDPDRHVAVTLARLTSALEGMA